MQNPVAASIMLHTSLTGLDRKALRRRLVVFFLALAVPTGILIYQAYSQLKWEAFHQYQGLAGELAARIDSQFARWIAVEEARSFAEYAFLNVAGDPAANFLQRSPLSGYPVESSIPGLIGYFQIDTGGAFTTPLLPPAGTSPAAYGISSAELEQRLALQDRIQQILSRNRLVQGGAGEHGGGKEPAAGRRLAEELSRDRPPRPEAPQTAADQDALEAWSVDEYVTLPSEKKAELAAPGQAAFDRLSKSVPGGEREGTPARALGRVEDLQLDYRYQGEPAAEVARQNTATGTRLAAKRMRKERSALPEPVPGAPAAFPEGAAGGAATPSATIQLPDQSPLRILAFESEIDPFEFSLLDSGHFVLFRKVWRDGQRYIQGALIEQQPFLRGVIEPVFQSTALAQMSDLIVAWRGSVFTAFSGGAAQAYRSSAAALRGALLYRSRLSAPLDELELLFSITRLPAGPGARVIGWSAAILLLVLCGGFYLMYRMGAGQIDLARQQQDFVSAVSHELKTPLTSIRMYGEMLREGWASDAQKKTYYDYIFAESERLSRLIGNVLQLARMTRNDLAADTRPIAVAELMDGIRSRIASQIERAGFELRVDCNGEAARAVIRVDADWFTQIVINLVDNGIKFSAAAERKVIDLHCRRLRDGRVQFGVRDYGPGVPRDQMKKIFRLFYRSENELTRETVGTGIGLALVKQLAAAMAARVDVVNLEPGAEFRVIFAASGA